jgi:hypothetical protein
MKTQTQTSFIIFLTLANAACSLDMNGTGYVALGPDGGVLSSSSSDKSEASADDAGASLPTSTSIDAGALSDVIGPVAPSACTIMSTCCATLALSCDTCAAPCATAVMTGDEMGCTTYESLLNQVSPNAKCWP